MKEIVLINAPETFLGDNCASPPLGLLYLAAMFPEDQYRVSVYDGVILGWDKTMELIKRDNPMVVGISCLTPNRMKVIKLAKLIKEFNPEIKVVLGGVHPTIMGRQMLENYPFINFVVLGEGEVTFKELSDVLFSDSLKDLKNVDGIMYRDQGQIVINKWRSPVKDLDTIPFPRWDLINVDDYIPFGGNVRPVTVKGIDISKVRKHFVVFSRGCVGQCIFCSTWWIWRGYRHRSPENMLAEIIFLYKNYGTQNLDFVDDCFTVDKEAVKKLCQLIVKSGLKIAFKCSSRTDLLDEELISKLKEAGCYEISFGVESGDPSILQALNKKNTIDNTVKTFVLMKKYGILATATMITGSIGENYKTINRSVKFLKKIKPDYVGTAKGLLIFPGTKAYYYCRNKGYMNDDYWLGEEPFKIFDFEFNQKDIKCFDVAVRRRIYLTPFRFLNHFYILGLNFLINKYKGLKFRLKRIKSLFLTFGFKIIHLLCSLMVTKRRRI